MRIEEYSYQEFLRLFSIESFKNQIRMQVLLKNHKCVKCGLKGTLWAVEKTGNLGLHFNLYSETKKGQILMTIDHIHPKSKGGLDNSENLQTLCFPCNLRKGNKI